MNQINITKVAHLKGHRASIYTHCADSDGLLFSADGSGLIAQWNFPNNTDAKAYAHGEAPIYCLLASKNMELLAGTAQGTLLRFKKGQLDTKIQGHREAVFQYKPFNDGYLSAGQDGFLRHWDQGMQLINEVQISKQSLRCLIIRNDELFVGSSDALSYRLNLQLQILDSYSIHSHSVFDLALLDRVLISASRDAHIAFTHLDSGLVLDKIPAHLGHVKSLALHPDKNLLLSSSMDKTIKIWDPIKRCLLKVIDFERYAGHSNSINSVYWLNSSMFVSCSDDRSLIVWELNI